MVRIPSEYQEVEYLESTGTQYIDLPFGFLVGNDVSWDTASLFERRRQILLNTPHIETTSGSIATFNTDMSTNLTDMKIHFQPVQEGTGDPSPDDNVRPITGWDGVTVTRCGKNLAEKIYGLDSNGGNALSTTVVERGEDGIVSSLIPVCSGCTYKMSCTGQTTYARHFWFDDYPLNNPRPVSIGGTYSILGSYSAPENAKWLFVVWTRQENVNTCGDVQIEIGSTATDYEPYTAIEIPISFGRTIYGGHVDLVKGEVVEEYGSVDLSTVGFSQYGKSIHCWSGAISDMVFGNQLDAGTLYCDSYKPDSKKSILNNGYNLGIWGYSTTQRKVIIRNDAYIDEDGVYDITAFNESLQGVLLYYPLATPNVYPLTPQTIKALKGINNIWSDANGNIELKFWTH